MINSFLKVNIFFVTFFFPIFVFAQDNNTKVTSVEQFFQKLNGLLGTLVVPIFGLALLAFLWGVFRYALTSDLKERKTAINFMISGIIALFVMVSVWGFVFMIREFFGFEQSSSVNWFPEIDPVEGVPDKNAVNLGNPNELDTSNKVDILGNHENDPTVNTDDFPVAKDTTDSGTPTTHGTFDPPPQREF